MKIDFERHRASELQFERDLRRYVRKISHLLSKARTVSEVNQIMKRFDDSAVMNDALKKSIKCMVDAQERKNKNTFKASINSIETTTRKLNIKITTKIDLDKYYKKGLELIQLTKKEMTKQAKIVVKRIRKKQFGAMLLIFLAFYGTMSKSFEAQLRNMTLEELKEKYLEEILKKKNLKITTVRGRTLTGNVYSGINEERSKHINAVGYIWKAIFRNTRVSHAKMHNVIVTFGDIPTPGIYEPYPNDREVIPGEDYNCQCYSFPIINEKQVKNISKGGKVNIWHLEKITSMSIKNALILLNFRKE